MSSTLVWHPVTNTKPLDDVLKFALRKRYRECVDTSMDSGDIPYLTGLLHAGIRDAETLIDAIKKHTEIIVKEEY